jgi:mutator protein MutT
MSKKITVALGVIRNNQGEILLIKRAKPEEAKGGKKLLWAFPGGVPEEKETLEKAVIREILKETGFLVLLDKKISSRSYPKPLVKLHYFYGKVISKVPLREIEEKQEIAEYRWVKPEEIEDLVTTDLDPGVARFLRIGDH